MTISPTHQLLLLELLVVSGDIAVDASHDGTLLGRNLDLCLKAGWVTAKPMGSFRTFSLTATGRSMAASDKGSPA